MSSLIPMRESAHLGAPQMYGAPTASSASDESSAEDISLREVLRVLRRHVWMIAAITSLAFGVSAYLALRAQPLYQARAMIRLLDEREALTGGLQGAAMDGILGKQNDPLLSQLQVLRSRGVAAKVVSDLGLQLRSNTPGFSVADVQGVVVSDGVTPDTLQLQFLEREYQVQATSAGRVRAAYGVPVEVSGARFVVPAVPSVDKAEMVLLDREEAVDDLLRNLRASPRDKTDVIDVEYTSASPALAQQVVNTTVRIFREMNAQQAQEQSIRRRVFVEGQLAETDSVLGKAQLALSRFREREQVFSSQAKMAAEQEGLMGLDVRREELVADRQMYLQLMRRLQQAPAGGSHRELRALVSTPGISTNPVVVQLYTQLARYETSLDSLTTGEWGSAATNPDVERLRTLVASTRAGLVEAVRAHIASTDARIEALEGLRARSASQIQTLPSAEAEEMRLTQRVAAMQAAAQQLRQEYQNARIAEAVEAGQVQVVDLAATPRQPIDSGRGLKMGLGLALGLIMGSGAAFLREHMNTRIRSKEDIEELLRVPMLAIIPRLARSALGGQGKLRLPVPALEAQTKPRGGRVSGGLHELVTVSDVRSPGAEAFRTLRTNLIFSQAVETLRTIVVTSATPSDGKTTTSANLAVTFAQQGLKVLLVDCDLRRGRLHRVFGLPQAPGLTELVLGHASSGAVIRASQVEGLSVLTSGTLPPNPGELLGGARTTKTIELLKEQFDLIILDTAPLMAAADASVLGLRTDGVLLVVRAGHTERAAAQQSIQQLRAVGTRVIGGVLNDPNGEAQRYGGYYYYEYYGEKEPEASALSPATVGTPS